MRGLLSISEVRKWERAKPLLRPADVTLQIPDLSKFTEATGWQPKHNFHDSAVDLLEYWRKQINHEKVKSHENPC